MPWRLNGRLLLIGALVMLMPLVLAGCEEPAEETPPPIETPAVTPEPVTPVPVTPEPVTPTPVTPDVTPTPATPEPVTPTPQPATPTPVTPDVTPTPVVPVPPVTGPAAGEVNVLILQEVEGSGQMGVAVLREQDGQTEITIGLLTALAAGQQQVTYSAGVMSGACDMPGDVTHDLGSLSNGVAVASVPEEPQTLLGQELAIAVHDPTDTQAIVACGNMADASSVAPGEDPGVTLPAPGTAQ